MGKPHEYITFTSTYELLMYIYRMWSAWRKTQGHDTNTSNGTDEEERAFAVAFNAGISVSDTNGVLESARFVVLPLRTGAILDMLHSARRWLDPDLNIPPIEEWMAMTDAQRDETSKRAAQLREEESARRGW